jgi:hypothetical protein
MPASEWRSGDGHDVVVTLDGGGGVAAVVPVDPAVLARFLLAVNGLGGDDMAQIGDPPPADRRDPAAWGRLVIARGEYGQVTMIDPELYWDGIYQWFRSRGVDYDSVPRHETGAWTR